MVSIEGFDWDSGNWPKCGKHGLSQEEIESIFSQPFSLSSDLKHSNQEDRLLAIGRTSKGRFALVAFTLRGDKKRLLRPISARYMHQKEILAYETQAHSPPKN